MRGRWHENILLSLLPEALMVATITGRGHHQDMWRSSACSSVIDSTCGSQRFLGYSVAVRELFTDPSSGTISYGRKPRDARTTKTQRPFGTLAVPRCARFTCFTCQSLGPTTLVRKFLFQVNPGLSRTFEVPTDLLHSPVEVGVLQLLTEARTYKLPVMQGTITTFAVRTRDHPLECGSKPQDVKLR